MQPTDIIHDKKTEAQAKALYTEAFPKEERISWWLLKLNARRNGIDLTAWMDGDPRAMDRDLIVALNELSKDEKHKKGMFVPIIEGLNAKDAE